MPNYARIGTTQESTTSFSVTIFIPGYGNITVPGDVTSTTTLVAMEDVTLEYSTLPLKNCIKAYNETTINFYINGTTETISEWTDYWFYKGVGVVKVSSSEGIETIIESYVNGVSRSYVD